MGLGTREPWEGPTEEEGGSQGLALPCWVGCSAGTSCNDSHSHQTGHCAPSILCALATFDFANTGAYFVLLGSK